MDEVEDTGRTPGAAEGTEFLVQLARTRRFSLGRPSGFRVAHDGTILFMRSGPRDPEASLWAIDPGTGRERCLARAGDLLAAASEPTEFEKEQRERLRQRTTGITGFHLCAGDTRIAVPLGGRLFLLDLAGNVISSPTLPEGAADPRPDPSGERVAYVHDGDLWVTGRDGPPVRLTHHEGPGVTWGLAEYIAREEMGRLEGWWWSPDGAHIAVTRVDERQVETWWLPDVAEPGGRPRAWPYPRPGRNNADVSLFVVHPEDGTAIEVDWDRGTFPYLAKVAWQANAPLTILVQDRPQRTERVLTVDAESGATSLLLEETDPTWLNLPAGPLRWLPSGAAFVWPSERDQGAVLQLVDPAGARRDVTDPELGLRRVALVTEEEAVVVASPEPTREHIARVRLDDGTVRWVEDRPGVASWAGNADVDIVTFGSLDSSPLVRRRTRGGPWEPVLSLAETPDLDPDGDIVVVGDRGLRASVVLPRDASSAARSVPVLLDVYGGPHVQRVLESRDDLVAARWFADHASVAVVTIDGRGTPGRGRAWERALHGDFSGVTLEDQVVGLEAVGALYPALDLGRVIARGWSFGGYMAALCVLRRPDLFRGAVAGAPVVDWLDYDTHYTERYLGHPAENPEAYRRSSLLEDACRGLQRPLLLVHGTADDNVFFSHTVKLSDALLRSGSPHAVLPLANQTHMADDEETTIRLAEVTAAFIADTLDL